MNKTRPASAEWLDIRAVTEYASVSDRTVRTWIHAIMNPLPASQIGGKVLVRRRDLDGWLEAHRIVPSESVSKIVDELMHEVVS